MGTFLIIVAIIAVLFLLSIFTATGRRCWAAIGEGMSGIADACDSLDMGGGDGDGGGGGD